MPWVDTVGAVLLVLWAVVMWVAVGVLAYANRVRCGRGCSGRAWR